jgi:hypothetical protein
VLGLLLNAAATVRHNATTLGAALAYQTLLADIGQICSGGTSRQAPVLPHKPFDAEDACPICMGLGAAFALAAAEHSYVQPSLLALPAFRLPSVVAPEPPRSAYPPARGPPSLA